MGSIHEIKKTSKKSRDTAPLSSVADPERFDADPDPLFKLMRIRIQIF